MRISYISSDVASSQKEFCKDASCVLNSNGLVSCIPPCKHDSKCAPNYSRWPFDRQNCTIHIGTWVDSGDEIDFKLMKSVVTDDDLSSQNSEWRLIQATYRRDPGNFTNTKVTYPSLTFSFLIERHSASHAVYILLPTLCTIWWTFLLLLLSKAIRINWSHWNCEYFIFSFGAFEFVIIMGGFWQ